MYNLKDQVRIIAVSQVPIEISTKKERKKPFQHVRDR